MSVGHDAHKSGTRSGDRRPISDLCTHQQHRRAGIYDSEHHHGRLSAMSDCCPYLATMSSRETLRAQASMKARAERIRAQALVSTEAVTDTRE